MSAPRKPENRTDSGGSTVKPGKGAFRPSDPARFPFDVVADLYLFIADLETPQGPVDGQDNRLSPT